MDRSLTTLARERYRPARLSTLAPWVLERTPAERLAIDVAHRWEEAADAFLEALLALGSGRGFDRSLERGAPADRGEAGDEREEPARPGHRRVRAGGTGTARDRPVLEGEKVEASFPPEGDSATRSVTFDEALPREPGALEADSIAARLRAPGAGEEGGRRPAGPALPGEPPASPRTRAVRPDGFEPPWTAADPGEDRGPRPLARGGAARAIGGEAPVPRGRVGPLPEPGSPARSGTSAVPGGGSRRPRPVARPERAAPVRREEPGFEDAQREDAGARLAGSRSLDPLAIEALLDDLRRRNEALEEWARTGF
jgi:hypothetical protein